MTHLPLSLSMQKNGTYSMTHLPLSLSMQKNSPPGTYSITHLPLSLSMQKNSPPGTYSMTKYTHILSWKLPRIWMMNGWSTDKSRPSSLCRCST